MQLVAVNLPRETTLTFLLKNQLYMYTKIFWVLSKLPEAGKKTKTFENHLLFKNFGFEAQIMEVLIKLWLSYIII